MHTSQVNKRAGEALRAKILHYILMNPGCRQVEICAHFGIAPYTARRHVGMIRAGWRPEEPVEN
jgi:predicted transcriptional regulator